MNLRRAIIVLLFSIGIVAVAIFAWVNSSRRHRSDNASTPPTDRAPAAAALESPPPEAVGPFYVGVSSLDVDANERAGKLFEELSGKLPKEPAIWTNLGIARLRLGDSPGAAEALDKAAALSPQNGRISLLLATLDEDAGQFPRAIERLRSLPAPDDTVLYRLGELLGRTGHNADQRGQLELFDRIRQHQPKNPVIALNRARLLARMENKILLTEAINDLEAHRENWSAAAGRQLESAKTAVTAGNFRSAAAELTFLQNLVQSTPAYQAGLIALGVTSGSVGQPIRAFLYYRQPEIVVAAADESLHFDEVGDPLLSAPPDLSLALELGAKSGSSLLSFSGGKLHIGAGPELVLPVSASSAPAPRGRNTVCAVDLNGDFLEDLAVVDHEGLKLWTQNQDGRFTALPPTGGLQSVFAQPGHGVRAFDYDADGDLDLLIARDGAPPQLLRNNSDGGFTAVAALASFPEARDLGWADFDGDGDGDIALLDVAGRVLISWNDRAGAFTAPELVSESPAVALTYGDIFGTGEMDVVTLDRNGVIRNLHFDRNTRKWSARELARWSNPPDLPSAFAKQRVSLSVADLDNNGAIDLVASAGTTSAIWLNEGAAKFHHLDHTPALFVTSIADMDGDGLLDLVGLTDKGSAVAHTRGTKGYHWQSIQTRSLSTQADGRINSYGIGGRIEVRAGALLTAAPIISPFTHFGLGDHDTVGIARIVWPNGVAQVEFDLQPDQVVTATQRLKGSCPWVFARGDDGTFHFVKDFIWRSPLGMRINSQDTAGVDQTEDWILIPGKFLTVHDGAYEIRITAELWETHFFDHIAMQVVDHPDSFSAIIDERFVPTKQPKLEVLATSRAQPFAQAQDQSGHDVLKTLRTIDGNYVNDFPLGEFQGIARDHWIEFQLPDDAPADRPLVIVGEGWIYPTDSSLNVAISQGNHPPPQGLRLEEYDPHAGWHAIGGELGFPAGKNKTVVIPLPSESLRAGHRRFRLRTNLEIYWDQLGWAVALQNAEMKTSPAETLTAELRHRGFSKLAAPDRRQPDVPRHYDQLSGPGPKWRDLEGYYTRYGDVRELLGQTDDRYVIMNAGDEIVLRFAAPALPAAGWTRDFVLVGDGWVKDGDFNTANSQTVRPLPSHAIRHYGGPPQPLEADPVFQQHREDWRNFHTRYVTPSAFDAGLMKSTGVKSEGGTP